MRRFINYFFLTVVLINFIGAPTIAQEVEEQTPTAENIAEDVVVDEVSVTATRTERKTKEVPASIEVISQEDIEDSKIHNIKDALAGSAGIQVDSKNGGMSSRLIIRGAGAKARYGIREIMILLNGVPITDPDGFSKLDGIDPEQIASIEVVKGPNSTLWGANAAGGVINVITKSPLKQVGGKIKVSYGNFGTRDGSVYYADSLTDAFYYSFGLSHRASDNDWRRWNKMSANNVSVAPSFVFEDGTKWENYLTYNKTDMQLPGSLNEEMFKDYEDTGEAPESDGIWQHSGRYSDSLTFSSKLNMPLGDFTFKPMIFVNQWSHYHPVTGAINDGEATVLGLDLQMDHKHSFGTLSVGYSTRTDDQKGDKYQYGDVETETTTSGWGASATTTTTVLSTNSDEKGDLMSTSTRKTTITGYYLQESLKLDDTWIIDLGIRQDEIKFNVEEDIETEWDWGKSYWKECTADCEVKVEKTYSATSPRVAVSYGVNENLNVFANYSKGIQTPTDSELTANPELDLVTATNNEVGIKGRGDGWSVDLVYYQTMLENEVVTTVNEAGESYYDNVGKTSKKGYELSAAYEVIEALTVGGSYTKSEHKYEDYIEIISVYDPVQRKMVDYEFDRSGNYAVYSPEYQYSLYAKYKDENGIKFKIQTDTWGPYYLDPANSEQYDGYKNITKAMIGYEFDAFDITLNIQNLTDERYAIEVKKKSTVDDTGDKSYSPAPPRSYLASIKYRF